MSSFRKFVDINRRVLAVLAIVAVSLLLSSGTDNAVAAAGERTVTIVPSSGDAGGQVVIPIVVDSQGDELGMTFSIAWDPAILSNPVVSLGSGAPAGGSLGTNPNQVASGRLGILTDFTIPFAVSPPDREIVKVTFDIAANAASGNTPVIFVAGPVPLSIGNTAGALVPATYTPGMVTVTAVSSLVTVSGRVTTPSGQNLRNAVVSMIDENNVRRVATTSSFGLFSFGDVLTGQTYTFTVASKRYRFSPKVVPVTAAIGDLDFVGLE